MEVVLSGALFRTHTRPRRFLISSLRRTKSVSALQQALPVTRLRSRAFRNLAIIYAYSRLATAVIIHSIHGLLAVSLPAGYLDYQECRTKEGIIPGKFEDIRMGADGVLTLTQPSSLRFYVQKNVAVN